MGRGTVLLAVAAMVVMLQLCRTVFVMPPRQMKTTASPSSSLAGLKSDVTGDVGIQNTRVAMQFFGGTSEAPAPKKREKPFRLPPFFTTFASVALLGYAMYFFLVNGK